MARSSKHRKPKDNSIAIAMASILATPVAVAASTSSAHAASVDDWDEIAECESSGQWNRPDGDGGRSSGGLQFQPPSWSDALKYLKSKGVDTSAYPQGGGHQAYKATKQQQIIAGEALLALQGPSAWTCNAKTGYPLKSSGPHASMFEGGANPYPARASRSTPAAKPTSLQSRYTVKRGDTLYRIALTLGIKGGWKELHRHNVQTVPNPNLIEVGQVLNVPRRSAPAPATPVSSPKPPAAAGWVKPIDKPITTGYGVRGNWGLGWHPALDFTAPSGTPVKAVGRATVASVGGAGASYGNHVILKLSDGKYALYGHLSKVTVSRGQSVATGQTVGLVGSTGRSSGPHLHFEIRIDPTAYSGSNFINPVTYLRSKGVAI